MIQSKFPSWTTNLVGYGRNSLILVLYYYKRGGEMVKNTENELSKDHILVCLSSSPSNERIVRMAGKMAQAFCGSLTALYVQTPGDTVMNTADMSRLQANMRLAQQLGAEIVTTCRFRINGAPFSRQRCKRLAPAVCCPFIACL